jgi:DNA-binding NtrC family response regulator
LQASLIESELFGYEKGAFTGAQQSQPGLIEVAEGGTLFIDEVAEMTPALQAKLLRVLEDGRYRRVDGTKERRANVRVIAATNKPLEGEQKAGRFREDLFYHLNVVSIDLPPLRERREDIPALVEHLLTTRQLGKVRCRVIPDAMQALLNYGWPGNIRELANVVERAQILAEDNVITLDNLPEAMQASIDMPAETGPLNLCELERKATQAALQQAKGNKVHAAKLLGITRRALYRLITKYGLEGKQGEGGAASVVERAQILAEDDLISLDNLPKAMRASVDMPAETSPLNLCELERKATQAALRQAKGNKVHAAKLLGINRRALYRLITKYGLERKQGEGGASSG